MNKLNLNYEPDDPNETCKYPRCRNCYHEDNSDSHMCDKCILYHKNPKTIFRSMVNLSPFEILISGDVSTKDLKLVSTRFIDQFVKSANRECRDITAIFNKNIETLSSEYKCRNNSDSN